MTVTKPQFQALWYGFKKGGAAFAPGGTMGGARSRMINRMIKDCLLNDRAPYPITLKGMQKLRDACRERWAKSGCMAYQQDLNEVEAALK